MAVAKTITHSNKDLTESAQLESECRRAVGEVQAAVLEVYGALNLDPGLPQDASRRLGLNKNLTWKVSKILTEPDGLAVISHFPGNSGWELLVQALTDAGAPAALVGNVNTSLERFNEFVERHAGSRQHLELILDSMGAGNGGAGQLEASRAMAFQGNSGIWGVQARTRLTAGFVLPSKADPHLVDTVLAVGLLGFRRLRPNVAWPLARFMSYSDSGREKDRAREPVEPDAAVPGLIRSVSSGVLPHIEPVINGSAVEYLLRAGPVGNAGAFDCFFGEVIRGESRYQTSDDDHGEFATSITMPVETLIFDLFIHRDMGVAEPPETIVYGRPQGGQDDPATRRDELRLPLPERAVELVGRPPVVVTPLVPRYNELVALVMRRLEASLADFRAFRLSLKFPPMPSSVVVRWPLEQPGR